MRGPSEEEVQKKRDEGMKVRLELFALCWLCEAVQLANLLLIAVHIAAVTVAIMYHTIPLAALAS